MASAIIVHARQEMVNRLDSYELENPELFAKVTQFIESKIIPIVLRHAISGVALINTENRPLQALRLDGVEPTPQNGIAGTYPHFKRFYLIAQPKPAPAVQRFIAFLQSPVGKEILMRAGNWVP